MADFIPGGDHEFLTWAQNFLSVADEFKLEAGLTPTQIQEIGDAIAEYVNALGTADTLRNQAIAATERKNVTREALDDLIRTTVKRIKVAPGITNTILIGMNLTVPTDQRSRTSPQQPNHLMAELEEDGRVHLQWDANGNTAGTQYIVEKRKLPQGEYVIIGTGTRRSLTDTTADSGSPAAYRVTAQRGGTMSQPSASVTFGIDM